MAEEYSIYEVLEETGTSYGICKTILTEDLQMS
jgi:hypothetical protein